MDMGSEIYRRKSMIYKFAKYYTTLSVPEFFLRSIIMSQQFFLTRYKYALTIQPSSYVKKLIESQFSWVELDKFKYHDETKMLNKYVCAVI